MEELIFFGVLIALSLLDMVAKKVRKSQEGAAEGEDGDASMPGTWEREEAASGPNGPEYAGSYGESGSSADDASGRSSDSMVPVNIWEEIGALARGERTPAGLPSDGSARDESPTEPSSRDLPPVFDPGPRRQGRPEAAQGSGDRAEVWQAEVGRGGSVRRNEVGQRAIGEHPIHLSHADYGTDPSERRRPPEPARPEPRSAEARAVRATLQSGRGAELRKAFILQEVLGEPLAYREPGPNEV